MSPTALVLAAHGVRDEPAQSVMLRHCMTRLEATGAFDEVAVAFHLGEPSLVSVLDGLEADRVTVVPLMTSAGFFTEVVLPGELRQNRRYSHVQLEVTDPVGTHPAMVSLVARRVAACMAEHDLSPDSTTVAVIGHGTVRHPASRAAVVSLVDSLRRRDIGAEFLCAFLDETPSVQSIPDRATNTSILAVPFLIAPGVHATRDIPIRLGLKPPADNRLPIAQRVGRYYIVCDDAVGTDGGLADIVADLAGVGSLVVPECMQ